MAFFQSFFLLSSVHPPPPPPLPLFFWVYPSRQKTESDLDQAEADRVAVLAAMNDRNLVALLDDIVQRCQGILVPASGAVVRNVDANTEPLRAEPDSAPSPLEARKHQGPSYPLVDDIGRLGSEFMHRERIIQVVRSDSRSFAQ